MNTMTLMKVLFTPTAGWLEAVNAKNSPLRILLLLVVPSMLLPSVMLQHTAEHYQLLLMSLGNKQWVLNVPYLMLLEAITFVVLIYQIRNISNTYGANIEYQEAFLLASISIIPFCFSFLALSYPSTGLMFLLVFGALGYSAFIFYKGICVLNDTQEEIYSAHIVYTVVGAAGSWVVLLAILISVS